MQPVASFIAFQLFWFAAVLGAAAGSLWAGPAALVPLVVLHVLWLPREARGRELVTLAGVGLVGTLMDTGLHAANLTSYPGTAAVWDVTLVPPWITSLWIAFATQRQTSLRWLRGRPLLAAVLGAVGGPLSWRAGVALGAAGMGEPPLATWVALAIQYGLIMPVLMRLGAPPRLPLSEVPDVDPGSASSVARV